MHSARAAAQIRGLIRESTQRKNKLTAMCDEVFPELTRVVKDQNSLFALVLRERFPTPQAAAAASFATLQEIGGSTRSLSDARLLERQDLVAQSIGITMSRACGASCWNRTR